MNHTLSLHSAKTHKIHQVNNALSNCRSLPALCSSAISIYQSPHFNNPPCPVSLPMFINRSKSLNNSDQVNWPQLGSHCISAILLFITCWLPTAFLTAAVPNISALLKSLIPALLPPLLALNLTSYWENWNHPNVSLHHCPPFLLKKKICESLLRCFWIYLRKWFPLQGNSIMFWWTDLGLESDRPS